MRPRHAELFASDLDEDTAIKYIDRFLMYYIHTADKLTRTSVWIENLEGGIEHLREVIIEDKLGICSILEEDIERLISNYKCEWAEVVNDPAKREKFQHFGNTKKPDPSVTFINERGQIRPPDWPKESAPPVLPADAVGTQKEWFFAGSVSSVPEDGGVSIAYGNTQIAVFNFTSRGQWFATQNMCPHKMDMVLARGILGVGGRTEGRMSDAQKTVQSGDGCMSFGRRDEDRDLARRNQTWRNLGAASLCGTARRAIWRNVS